ncbi:hypothetical protein F5B22DRAFT_629537 [Xylaria bambusicola]|uniref:uncharacterized protein n=1 Tax=Xylaria bambusicola TaxID=326684 RepID=UPI0020088915|nr:uncharacterized protein F5B22DRAFT_629537 [Xylaria bambusicola]KAI0503374.1 hypothetical protein F5B22DRAFT_629537 [Xylaria bambusicola]
MSKRSIMLSIQFILAITVAIFNITFFVYVLKTYPTDERDIGTFMLGNCSRADWTNSAVHAAINILSTLLLGAGNYCMQLLSSPSREEVDRAHHQGQTMDIGLPSIWNLKNAERKRVIAWILLGVLATLLHLVWNSVVFSSIPIVAYPRATVTSDFKQFGDIWAESYPHPTNSHDFSSIWPLQESAANFTRLNTSSCIEQYINSREATSSLIVVTSNSSAAENEGSSLLDSWLASSYNDNWRLSSRWICCAYLNESDWTRDCSLDWAKTFSDDWQVCSFGNVAPLFQVSHCLVGQSGNNEERCGVHYSAPLLLFVCIATILEVVAVGWAGLQLRSRASRGYQAPMVTIGDAIASNLETPDSMLPRNRTHPMNQRSRHRHDIDSKPILWPRKSRLSWFVAVDSRTWNISLCVFVFALGVPSILLAIAIRYLISADVDVSPTGLWQQGFGVQQLLLLDLVGRHGREQGSILIGNVLFANIWQVLVSFAYIFYNAILTKQVLANELLGYLRTDTKGHDIHKKTLRVSTPIGCQRSNYTLSIPFKYSVPMIIAFTLLHWLVSRSVFVIHSIGFSPGAENIRVSEHDSSLVGYSAFGIVSTLTIGGLIILALFVNSAIRRYPNAPRDLPLMAGNSAAIRALCQRPDDDEDAHLFPVSLGIYADEKTGAIDADGKLIFSTFIHLAAPQPEMSYVQPFIVHPNRTARKYGRLGEIFRRGGK